MQKLTRAISDCFAFFSLACFAYFTFFALAVIGWANRLLMYAAILMVILLAVQLIVMHFAFDHVPPVSKTIADWLN